MGIYRDFLNQTRKPEGVLGKMMVSGMNEGHAKLADWGMSHLTRIIPDKIAELGCGGGRNIHELLKRYPNASLTAVDHSTVSVNKATEYNDNLIKEGRCIIKQGDIALLDIGKQEYDLATAFETIYFWPGLEKCFSNVADILKPGGYFMIVNESDGNDEASIKYEKLIDGMRVYKIADIEDALKNSGFNKIIVDHHENKPWICILAKK